MTVILKDLVEDYYLVRLFQEPYKITVLSHNFYKGNVHEGEDDPSYEDDEYERQIFYMKFAGVLQNNRPFLDKICLDIDISLII